MRVVKLLIKIWVIKSQWCAFLLNLSKNERKMYSHIYYNISIYMSSEVINKILAYHEYY